MFVLSTFVYVAVGLVSASQAAATPIGGDAGMGQSHIQALDKQGNSLGYLWSSDTATYALKNGEGAVYLLQPAESTAYPGLTLWENRADASPWLGYAEGCGSFGPLMFSRTQGSSCTTSGQWSSYPDGHLTIGRGPTSFAVCGPDAQVVFSNRWISSDQEIDRETCNPIKLFVKPLM